MAAVVRLVDNILTVSLKITQNIFVPPKTVPIKLNQPLRKLSTISYWKYTAIMELRILKINDSHTISRKRRQRCRANGKYLMLKIKSAVFLGDHALHLLFLFYINDFPSALQQLQCK